MQILNKAIYVKILFGNNVRKVMSKILTLDGGV